ncbi:MAG: hypothetical protein Q9187_003400 [Circinaria calcarea]
MASPWAFSRAPRCFSCLHRILVTESFEPISPFRVQLRGKKKRARQPATIKAKLIRDIRGWGRKGSIVPVAPGRMRNIWYPEGKAEYMTDTQLQELQDVVIERDPLFGMDQAPEKEEPSAKVDVNLLSPHRAAQIIAMNVPEYIDFYRTPISAPEPEKPTYIPKQSYQDSVSSAAADLAAASELEPKPQMIPIFGSVSPAEIAASIKALLGLKAESGDEEAARVVLNADDVIIAQKDVEDSSGEAGRIKALGDFAIDIRVKGGEPVRRMVRVKAQE